MVKLCFITQNQAQTKKLGQALAKKILKKTPARQAVILGLEGDLGGGKTTFLQGFAAGLSLKERILSPTFVIMRRYKMQSRKRETKSFYHLDCYRLARPKEILSLGFKKIIADPRNIVAVEWAEKIKKLLPKQTIWLRFQFVDDKKRKISIKQ